MSRIDKVNQLVKKEISKIVQYDLKDPRLGFVTITKVDVSKDLRHAKIYFSVLGEPAAAKRAEDGLNSAKGFVRRLIGQRVRIRYTPEFVFIYDRSIEFSIQIEEELQRLNNDRAANPENNTE